MTLRSSLFLLAVLATGATAQAQGLKVGVLDPDLIVVRMPEYAQVRAEIAELETQIGATLQAKSDSAVAINNELAAMGDSPVVAAGGREQKQRELQRLVNELQNSEENALRYLSQQEIQRLQPALIRLNRAIQELSAEMGIDLVLTPVANNAPVLLYANFDSERVVDMTMPLLDKLGIEISAEEAAAMQASPEAPLTPPNSGPPPAPAEN